MLKSRGKLVLLAIVLATIVMTFWIRDSAPSYQKCQTNYQAERYREKQEENAATFFVVRGLAYRCTNRLIENHRDAILAVATVLLTIVTGFLVWVGYRQITTTRAQLRAYVFIKPYHTDVRPDGKAISIKYSIENTGDTPAYNVQHAGDIRLLPFPLPAKAIVLSSSDFVGGVSLGKGVPISGERVQEIDIASIKDKAFYLVVIVKYENAFKKLRTTRLCAAADIAGAYRDYIARKAQDTAIESGGNVEWYYPTQHNDSD